MINNDTEKVVMVEWYDARFFPGTYSQPKCVEHKMCRFNSLGYLISKDTTTTIIAGEYDDEEEFRDITLIPTGSIIGIKELVIGALV